VVVGDADTGALVGEARAAHPDGTEIDPVHWWQALQSATAGPARDRRPAVHAAKRQPVGQPLVACSRAITISRRRSAQRAPGDVVRLVGVRLGRASP
jgi:hypothetical protein